MLALALFAGLGQAREELVTLNFVNADIESVIKAMGQITGRNFIIDPRVKGTINIVSAQPVSRALTYQIFLSALRLQGFTAVEDAGMTKIVPEADAKLHGIPTRGVKQGGSGSQLVTQVFALKHESANMLVPILRPLVAPNNTIAAYPGNNTLVVTDYADNVQRIARIIASIDVAGAGDPQIIKLNNASAAEVANLVAKLSTDTGGAPQGGVAEPTQRVSIVADPRTNSIILRGDNPSKVGRLRKLVEELDSPTYRPGNLHVVYLKYAEAQKVADTLRGLLNAGGGGSGGASSAASMAGSTPPGGTQSGSGASATPGGSSFTTASSGATNSSIQADPATNSLIINAPDPVFESLKTVIDRIDTRRAQVYLEALIVEVSADKAAEFGIQWMGANNLANASSTSNRTFGATAFGGTGQNILSISQNPGTIGNGLSIGIVKGQITLPGLGTIANIGALARALESTNKANILSTPNLLTLDNEEAKIVIGQNVPFITGQYNLNNNNTGTTTNPFQTIERKDVGLTLKVKPQISEGGAIKVRIFQEVSSVKDTTNAAGIITNKRSIESMVEIEDGAIIALGGLVEDQLTNGVDQVPVLGDIPVLGGLFRYESRKKVKTNLMVFLRPVILRDTRAAEYNSVDRYQNLMRDQQTTQPERSLILPDLQSPTLPGFQLKDRAQPGPASQWETPGLRDGGGRPGGGPARRMSWDELQLEEAGNRLR